jgi:alkanesulfonate monooxygenase SsuD/methylene tetrahydromethanopterin reductase-like flavin-dependent oxidoreductase (luciferase family)
MSDLQRAVGLPNLEDYAEPDRLVELAVEAERAGWDGFFIWDTLVHEPPETPTADPQVVLGAIAAATDRIRIGALLTPLARRRPSKVARETVTLDRLSGGRLVFGAALGWSGSHEYTAFGEDGDARVRADKLDEALIVIERLWSGEPVHFAGAHYTVDGVRFEPRPLQRPRIPVWIGGAWPNRRPFRRAAHWDGVFPIHRDVPEEGTMTPEQLREIVAYVAEHRPAGLAAIDAIVEGNSEGDRAPLEDYAAAGLTWFIEKFGWWRGDLDHTRAGIRRGPPAM